VRCDGRGWRDGRSCLTRTVKSCGSGAAVLASSLREGAQATEAKQPFSGKSTKQAVKPLRREGLDASACTCMPVCSFFPSANSTRDLGCSKHPVFPAPSECEGKDDASLGQTCRENAKAYPRHCERSEAIHLFACRAMDCFAALAMTRKQHGVPVPAVGHESRVGCNVIGWVHPGH
jgi:hypothetical protein